MKLFTKTLASLAIAAVTLTGCMQDTQTVETTGVTLDKTTLALTVGDTETLIATVTPDDATNKAVTWTSSDENVATVDADGEVTAIEQGTATITATSAADGTKTATCAVTVTENEQPQDDRSTETTEEFDNSNFGLYKGVLAGSSGTIRIEINNGDNLARAIIVMDGETDILTSTATFTAGRAITGAQFTGEFSSFTFSVDADGGNPTIATITIEGHDSVVATVAKETSRSVTLCYEGTSTGGNDHRGVFNLVRNGNTYSGVSNAEDGFSCSFSGSIAADGSFSGTTNTTFNGLAVKLNYSGRFTGDKVSGTWGNSWSVNGETFTNSGNFSGGVADDSADQALIVAHPWKVAKCYEFTPSDYDNPDTPEDERYWYLTEEIGLIYTFHADGGLSVSYLTETETAEWEVDRSILTINIYESGSLVNILRYNITKLTDTEFNCTGVLRGSWEDGDGNSGTYTYQSIIEFVKP